MAGSKMRNPDLRRLRAIAMMQRRMANIGLSAIAQEFNVKPITVSDELAWAKKQGLIENYQHQLLNELVPEAIKTVKKAVAGGDVKASLEVLKGTGLLTTRHASPEAPAPDGASESLEIYVRKIGGVKSEALPTVREVAIDASSAAPPSLEGRFLEAPDGDAETLPSEAVASGDEAGAAHS